jgi:hypothetical protein
LKYRLLTLLHLTEQVCSECTKEGKGKTARIPASQGIIDRWFG